MSAIISFDQPRLRRPGIIAGVAISLVLHAVLLFGYRLSSPPAPPQPARTMTVWLQPPTPPKVVAKVEPPPARPEPQRKREPAHTAPRERAPAAVAQQPQPQPSSEPQAVTVLPREQDPLYADQQQKKFDMDAALKTARSVAKEKAKPGTLAAQLESHPLYPEDHQTQLQKGVAGAKKYDCLQAGAGMGILAPLAWAFDKHCKF
jgi:type IV secretory pathway VirB10-like protein